MPIIRVEMFAGRSSEIKQALAEQLTEATVNALGVSPESVRILLQEIDRESWFVSGRQLTPHKTKPRSEEPETIDDKGS